MMRAINEVDDESDACGMEIEPSTGATSIVSSPPAPRSCEGSTLSEGPQVSGEAQEERYALRRGAQKGTRSKSRQVSLAGRGVINVAAN